MDAHISERQARAYHLYSVAQPRRARNAIRSDADERVPYLSRIRSLVRQPVRRCRQRAKSNAYLKRSPHRRADDLSYAGSPPPSRLRSRSRNGLARSDGCHRRMPRTLFFSVIDVADGGLRLRPCSRAKAFSTACAPEGFRAALDMPHYHFCKLAQYLISPPMVTMNIAIRPEHLMISSTANASAMIRLDVNLMQPFARLDLLTPAARA